LFFQARNLNARLFILLFELIDNAGFDHRIFVYSPPINFSLSQS
jgi:hypothetical protein